MSGAWTPEKVAAFKAGFFEFLKCVKIDSKNKGADYCLGDGIYEAQHRFLDGIFDGLSDDIHDFKILKSRQLGISTISEALFVFYLGITPGLQAACIFDSRQHLQSARMRIRGLINKLPASLKYPKIDKKNDSRDLMRLENGSKVTWMAAGVRETEASGGLGRSEGLNMVWASEVSTWNNEEGLVSLQETLSEDFPDRLYIWESTARGFNHWRDMWVDAKKDDMTQKPIFIGWWAHPDHRILSTDRKFPRYGEKPPTREELKVMDLVRERYGHAITQEELAWHRFKKDPTRDLEDGEKKGGQFKQQEQPTIEEECFTQAGSSFFDHEALTAHTLRIPTFNRSKNFRYSFGSNFSDTIITPASHHRDVELRIWDEPEPGVQYIVAADAAYGRNPNNDRSACQVVAAYADKIEQVAEYACPTANTTQFAWVVASLAAWYKNVSVIMEIDGPGEAVWKEYMELPSLVRSSFMRPAMEARGLTDVFNNVRNYVFQRPDAMSGRGNNWQWKTGNRKEAIMEKTKAMVSTGDLIIKSYETIEEMRKMARDGAAIESPSHKHDDRVLALAFAIRAWEDDVKRGLIASGRTRQAHLDSLKMTTRARYDIYMTNTIAGLFNRNERVAKQAARAQRLSLQSSRRR